jgi:hypothetical protein
MPHTLQNPAVGSRVREVPRAGEPGYPV